MHSSIILWKRVRIVSGLKMLIVLTCSSFLLLMFHLRAGFKVVIMSSSFQLSLISLDYSLAFWTNNKGLQLTKLLHTCHVCYHSETFLREAHSSYPFPLKHARGLWPKSTKLNTWCWLSVSFIAGAVTSASFWCHRRVQRTRCYPRVTMTTQKKGLITGDLWLSIAGVSVIHRTQQLINCSVKNCSNLSQLSLQLWNSYPWSCAYVTVSFAQKHFLLIQPGLPYACPDYPGHSRFNNSLLGCAARLLSWTDNNTGFETCKLYSLSKIIW